MTIRICIYDNKGGDNIRRPILSFIGILTMMLTELNVGTPTLPAGDKFVTLVVKMVYGTISTYCDICPLLADILLHTIFTTGIPDNTAIY